MTLTSLNLDYKNLTDEQFQKEKLDGIVTLYLCHNDLTFLKNLSVSLKMLHVTHNKLTSLLLPESLEYLDCSNNNLTELSLPRRLNVLNCSENPLERLDMNDSLEVLKCWGIKIKEFKELPTTLTSINCYRSMYENCMNLPYGLKFANDIKLIQYNKKLKALGFKASEKFPNKGKWDKINNLYLKWKYKVDGEMFKTFESQFAIMTASSHDNQLKEVGEEVATSTPQ